MRTKTAAIDSAVLSAAATSLRKIVAGRRRYLTGLLSLPPTNRLGKLRHGNSRKTLFVKSQAMFMPKGYYAKVRSPVTAPIHATVSAELPAVERLRLMRQQVRRAKRRGAWRVFDGPVRNGVGRDGLDRIVYQIKDHTPDTILHEMRHVVQNHRGVNANEHLIGRYIREAFLAPRAGQKIGRKHRTFAAVFGRAANSGNPMLLAELDASAATYLGMVKRYGRDYADKHHNLSGMLSYLQPKAKAGGGVPPLSSEYWHAIKNLLKQQLHRHPKAQAQIQPVGARYPFKRKQ